jgi:hypothetical protein
MLRMSLFARQLHQLPQNELGGRRYSEELDDALSVICDICDVIHDADLVDFVVSGFGQDAWPVDVRTDLAVVLGQIPDAISAIKHDEPFDLDFFEQGVERYLKFLPCENRYTIQCTSLTDWLPNPPDGEMSKSDVKDLILGLAKQFVDIAEKVCPKLAVEPLFLGWTTQLRRLQ